MSMKRNIRRALCALLCVIMLFTISACDIKFKDAPEQQAEEQTEPPAENTPEQESRPEPPGEPAEQPEPQPEPPKDEQPEPPADPVPAPEPPEEEPPVVLSPAEEILSGMSLEEKVGQMFLAQYPAGDAEYKASQYGLGGYLFFANFFESKNRDTVKSTLGSLQENVKIPMFTAVDEEGGTVCRVSSFSQFRGSKFQSPRNIIATGGMDAISADCAEKSDLLLSIGVNMNLGPVCDVTQSESAFMYKRSAASDAETVSAFAKTVVAIMNEKGIAGALKHFPGYGDNEDTHTDIVYDTRPLETFESSDFVPFKAAIDAGAKCVLVSHSIVNAIDPELPASLSPKINAILREQMGFNGVIVTDDMAMGAITQYTNGETAAVMAVSAGNDLVICSDFENQIGAVIEAVRDGRIPEEQINESVLRILNIKIDLGIIEL